MKYQSRLAFIPVFLFLFATLAGAQIVQDKTNILNQLSGNKITGAWRIDPKESDDTLLKLEAAIRDQKSQVTGENSTSPPISVSVMPPESLILAGDSKTITINEGFADFVVTRTDLTDGIIHVRKIPDGAESKVSAKNEDGVLNVEIVSPLGNTLKESYSLADGGKKLIVLLRFEDKDSTELLTLRRVYNRATLDLFDVGSRAGN